MEMMDIPDSIALFLSSMTVNGSSPNTVRAYKSDLLGWWTESRVKDPVCYTDPPSGLSETIPPTYTPMELELMAAEWLTRNRETWSPNTTNRKLSALKKFGKFLGIPNFLGNYKPPKAAKGVAHPLTEGVEGILKMIEAARKPEHKALGALCGLLGLRCGEALTIRPSDFDTDNMVLTVRGKGDKQRKIPVHDRVYEMLLPRMIHCWQDNERLVPLHDRTARRAWTSMGKRVGIDTSSHDGRMTFGTTAYYASNGDIRAVQELLGHASSHTTENYTEVSMTKMREAADIL